MPTSPSSKTRVMVDATVLIAGSGWSRWPREVLLAGLRGEFQLVLSPYVIRQAHRNLSKRFPEHLERFEEFLSQANFELVPDPTPEEVAQHKGLVRDESDIPIALAAINAGVDYLVSEDKDFTAHDETTAKLHEQLKVLLSGTFLRQVMGWTSKELEEIRHRTWSDLEES
jgi:predicted nucleic acid-binding protein